MQQQPRNRDSLNKAIRAIGAVTAASRVFTLYPSLEAASQHIMDFFTDRYPGRNGEPLVHECLRAAFEALDAARADGQDEPIAFRVALVAGASEVTRKRVGVEDRQDAIFWVPYEESFRAFLSRLGHDPQTAEVVVLDEPAPGAIADHMASMMLAVRILPAVDADRVCFAYLRPLEPVTA